MPVGCLGNNSNDQNELTNQSSFGFHDDGGGNGSGDKQVSL